MKEAPKFNAPGRQGRASALCVQARNWLPWQSVKGRSKGCLKTMAFRSKDGKQHLSFLALELGDRGNNSYYIDRESFEFYLFAPDQTGCSWKADVPSGFLCDTNLIKIVAPETPESTKLRKKQIPGRKSGATQRVLTQGPCHSGMHGLQRKNNGKREMVFSPSMPWMGCTKTLKTHFPPHIFFNVILSHNTST